MMMPNLFAYVVSTWKILNMLTNIYSGDLRHDRHNRRAERDVELIRKKSELIIWSIW